MHQIFSDAKSDTDLLNRQPFAAGIARTLFHALPDQNESFVFGLNGRWGSGKSTLLHFVKKEIERLHEEIDNDRFEIFEFNPWMFSGQEQLQRVFLGELFIKLGGKKGKLKNFAKKASEFIKRYVPTKSVLPDEWEESMDKILDVLGKEDPLEDIKKAVDDLLVKEKFRLYVVMDDIDRLTPDEITHVFQLVKLNANFKNTVFLLAYDKDVVVNAIEQKFKDNGERYLAKIVQIDYTLPEMLEEQVEAIFFERLDDFFKKQNIFYFSGDLKPYWSKYGLKNYFRTLRDVYRYINGLAFRLPEIYREVNISHFLILEAFRVFEFETFQRLYWECNDSLRRFQKFPDFSNEFWIDKVSQAARELIRAMKQNPAPNRDNKRLERGRELFHSDFFERYFALRISRKDLPTSDLHRFLANTENGVNCLTEIYKSGRFDNLLKRMASTDFENEVSTVGVEPVRELIRFLDEQMARDNDHVIALMWLILVVINLFNINKNNSTVIDKLWHLLLEDHTYPHYTRFVLLEGLLKKVKGAELAIFNTKALNRSIQSKERLIKETRRTFLYKNGDFIALHLLQNESAFVLTFILTYASLEPTVYPDFILKKFIGPEEMAWLLQQTTNFADENEECSWNTEVASLVLPQPVCDYLHKNLKHFIQEFDNEKTPPLPERRMKEIRFFLNEYSENMTESMKIPF